MSKEFPPRQITREHQSHEVQRILGLTGIAFAQLTQDTPFEQRFLFTDPQIAQLRERQIATFPIETFFLGKVLLKEIKPKDLNEKNRVFNMSQERLLRAYKEKNPILQTLFEISPAIVYCMEQNLLAGKLQSEIIEGLKRDLNEERGNYHIKVFIQLGLHALYPENNLSQNSKIRYKIWLEDVVNNWDSIKIAIDNLPQNLKKAVKRVIGGTEITRVAKEENLRLTQLILLVQSIRSGEWQYTPFHAVFKKKEIENVLQKSLPFDQMPQTKLLKSIIEEKAQGSNFRSMSKKLKVDYTLMSLLLNLFLRDISSELDNNPLSSSMQDFINSGKSVNSKIGRSVDTWKLLQRYQERLTQEMIRRNVSLSPGQHKFLLKCLKSLEEEKGLTQKESMFINFLSGHPKPRAERKQERQKWAILFINNPAFAALAEQEKELVQFLAQGIGITIAGRKADLRTDVALETVARIQANAQKPNKQ